MSPDFDFWDHDESPEPKTRIACKHLGIVWSNDECKSKCVCDRKSEGVCEGPECKMKE